jgi:phosphate transport system substrate-binding protein
MRKIISLTLRTIFTLFVFLAGLYILNKYEFLIAFNDIDNIVGMIPVDLVVTGATGISALLWMKHSRQLLPVSVSLALIVILSVFLFPTALRGNWWIGTVKSNESETAPDLSVYAPFSVNYRTARLSEISDLRLTADLPVLDGATALYPVYAAFAETVYDENAFSRGLVLCTNTRSAYEALISGDRDIIFAAGPSERQIAAARASGADLRLTPIGSEAFIFLAGKDNPIDNVTYQQIRNIYSGKTANWRTLGWKEGGRIITFQRPEGSGSQTGLQTIMGGLPIQVPQPLPDAGLIGTNSLMKQVSVRWQGVQPAIGYSYRYYATTMYANPEAKLLSVNGVAPSIENIQNRS